MSDSILNSCNFVEEHAVGPYRIRIYEPQLPKMSECFYHISPDASYYQLKGIIDELVKALRLNSNLSNCQFPKFQDLTAERITEAKNQLKLKYPVLPEGKVNTLSILAAYRSMRLLKIMPFLLDEDVDEIFLDNPDGFLYIDHRRWGRCRTNIHLSGREVSALKTRLRAESGLRLDAINPSLKTELFANDFQARFSIDIPPLSVDGAHLDIRKLRRKYFTLPELIFNGTLTSEAAAYLYFCLTRKRNITVIGEPGSGKTTLINTIDLLTPPEWRKITVEDVVESIPQTKFGNHQIRLKVKPFESLDREGLTKSVEIIKLLHRAPDWIYLGEIQTAEHSLAMFHALAAGLKGLQTCHAASPEQAIVRWATHHKVPVICFFDLDLIVQTKKLRISGKDVRRVIKICEVALPNKPVCLDISTINLQDIFSWDPADSTLKLACDLTEAPVFQKIIKIEHIDSAKFYDEYNAYKKLFKMLAQNQIFGVRENVEIFHYLHATKIGWEQDGSADWDEFLEFLRQHDARFEH